MATETTLNTINIFSSLASYNSNLSALGENEISLVAGAGVIVAQNLGQNGYVKFSNGLILQWGTIAVYANPKKYTFVIPFNETCFYCGGIPWCAPSAGYCGIAYTVSKTEFEMYYYRANSAVNVCWIAIGV